MRVMDSIRSERGIGLVTAMLVLFLMFMLGLAVYAQVDGQVRVSRIERERESSFNLAEAALSAHIFVLSKKWPSSATDPFPASCASAPSDPAPTTEPKCPLPVRDVANLFKGADFDPARTQFSWEVEVIDNDVDDVAADPAATPDTDPDTTPDVIETYLSDDLLKQAKDPDGNGDQSDSLVSTYDRNGDAKMWVRSEAIVRGENRILIAQVKVEEVALPFPQAAVVAGGFHTGNNGNDNIVNQESDDGETGPIYVNCASTDPDCTDYEDGQLNPTGGIICYTDTVSPQCAAPDIPEGLLDTLRNTAQSQGNYFDADDGCPASMEGRVNPATGTTDDGEVVFIEGPENCTFASNDTWHSDDDPGVFVMANGTINITGNSIFFGVIYAANLQGDDLDDQPVVNITGNPNIIGSLIVGGEGLLSVGSTSNPPGDFSAVVTYDPDLITPHVGFGTAGIVQNTWRELPSGGG